MLVVVLVGLPARGKTYLGQKLCKYLNWLGIHCRVFNVGQYRREIAGSNLDHSFFDSTNDKANQLRQQAAQMTLDDMLIWLKTSKGVGIYDATNTTRERREWLYANVPCQILYLESICTDEHLIRTNIMEVKVSGPDYKNDMAAEEAANDFLRRLAHYERAYEPLDKQTDGHVSFVKLTNVGKQVTLNKVYGWIPSRIVFYLMNIHLSPRRIFLSRHGESEFNQLGKIGGDSALSPNGIQYSVLLPAMLKECLGEESCQVWTSTLRRTIQTSSHLTYPKQSLKALDEIDAGVCDGLTYEEIKEQHPEEYAYRKSDKFLYRYQGGESYLDLVHRLEPLIMQLESEGNVLIIGHQATLRTIYAFFHNYKQSDIPYIDIPLHTLIELTPKAYGCTEKRHSAEIEAVNTYRARQKATDTGLERKGSRSGRVAATSYNE